MRRSSGRGADRRARSRAARRVWERADRHAREALGLSLLDVVDRNPRELRLADGTREIEVVDVRHGAPADAVGPVATHLSLSHDGAAAIAFVMLERA